jgi:soluble lytic murein transglycosylase-like protein
MAIPFDETITRTGTVRYGARVLLAWACVAGGAHAAALCADAGGSVFRAASDPGYVLSDVRCIARSGQVAAPAPEPEEAVVTLSAGVPVAPSEARSHAGATARKQAAGLQHARQRAERYAAWIDASARSWGHDPALLHAIVSVESDYVTEAVSPKGAIGLMQVMPATARRYGIVDARADLMDPRTNIELGAKHLASLKRAFDGDLRLVLAGYNAGEQAVINNGRRIPPFPETRAYVRDVLDRYLSFKRCRDVVDCVR